MVFIALLAVVLFAINAGWRAAGLPGMKEGGPWPFLVFAAVTAGATLGIILLLLRRFEMQGPAAIGLPFEGTAWAETAMGTLLGALPICLLVGLSLVSGYGNIGVGDVTPMSAVNALLPMALTLFLLAGWEELGLRGYLLRQLSIGLNPVAAVIITGALFGLMHSGNPGANWEGLAYTAIGGVLMGWLLVRSGSLWLLIGYHFGWNATAYQLFGLELSGKEGEAAMAVVTLTGSDWLTGGSYGFEASLPAVVFEVLVLLVFTSRRYGLRSV